MMSKMIIILLITAATAAIGNHNKDDNGEVIECKSLDMEENCVLMEECSWSTDWDECHNNDDTFFNDDDDDEGYTFLFSNNYAWRGIAWVKAAYVLGKKK